MHHFLPAERSHIKEFRICFLNPVLTRVCLRYQHLEARTLIIVMVCSCVASLFVTWVVRGAMRKAGVFDVPKGDRKLHRGPVAYEGGVALYAAFLVGIVTASLLEPRFFFEMTAVRGLVFGATCATAVGVADDLLDMPPWIKLLAQLGIGWAMYLYGFSIQKLSNPFGGELLVWPVTSVVATMLWYALLMNGINMVDGLDGLAAGIVGVCGITLCFIAQDLDQALAATLAIVIAGICLGFLPFNFSPATIFMGDAGSLLLWFLLASVTLLSSTKAPALLALLIPMLAVGLPLFETVFAFFRRAVHGRNPFQGDRRHLHHRLLNLGLSPRRTVLIFYYVTAFLGVVAYIIQRLEARATLALVVILLVGAIVAVENMRFLEKRNQAG